MLGISFTCSDFCVRGIKQGGVLQGVRDVQIISKLSDKVRAAVLGPFRGFIQDARGGQFCSL